MLLAQLPGIGKPILVVGDSADDAGYLYHDLSRLAGEEAVTLFPSGYKRDIKYGQVDGPSRILRTETLERWWHDPQLRFVVTYPEALAEKVASREEIAGHTLRLRKGVAADLTATTRWLRDNGFREVDYVYEPGQWARRGSILDIFGYSHELPYRLDFFGDDIESIRTFNIETQLSEERLDEIAVTPALEEQSGRGVSAMEFMPPDTLVALRDAAFTIERIRAVAAEKFSTSALIADEGDADAMSQVVDPESAISALEGCRQLLFTAGAAVGGGLSPDKVIDFGCTPRRSTTRIST